MHLKPSRAGHKINLKPGFILCALIALLLVGCGSASSTTSSTRASANAPAATTSAISSSAAPYGDCSVYHGDAASIDVYGPNAQTYCQHFIVSGAQAGAYWTENRPGEQVTGTVIGHAINWQLGCVLNPPTPSQPFISVDFNPMSTNETEPICARLVAAGWITAPAAP